MPEPVVASPLDGALRLELVGTDAGTATLRLEPTDLAVADGILHGGAIATCVDTASWYAARAASPGEWVVSALGIDFLRPGRMEPHRVSAVCRRAGRLLAVVVVEISSWDDPERVVALGRATLARVE